MAPAKNTKTSKTVSKTTKKATKKPVAKKPAAKKNVKKAVKKVVEKKEKVVRNRHFSIIYNGERLSATPSGKRPKQAANKALTSIFASMDDKTRESMIGKDINFALYENCKRRKNAKGVITPRRIFRYTGKRIETAKQTGGKDISISHEVILYCDKCKAMIEKLKTIDSKNIITKKQVIKNIKLYKKYLKADKLLKKPVLNKHIEDHEDEYKEIVNCTSCKKTQKTITYKYTNTVKKTEDSALTEEDKKITTEFIDAIEEKLKAERKAAEEKKEDKKVEKVEKKDEKKETPKKEKETKTVKKTTKKN